MRGSVRDGDPKRPSTRAAMCTSRLPVALLKGARRAGFVRGRDPEKEPHCRAAAVGSESVRTCKSEAARNRLPCLFLSPQSSSIGSRRRRQFLSIRQCNHLSGWLAWPHTKSVYLLCDARILFSLLNWALPVCPARLCDERTRRPKSAPVSGA